MHFLHSGNRLKHAIVVCLPILLSLFINHDTCAQSISCIQEVNVSLDNDCTSIIEPIDVLTDVVDGQTYTVELRDHNNNIIPNNTLTVDQLWTQVMVKVMQTGGNSCWGVMNVEDKLAPTINCIDTIRLDCYADLDTFPTYMDNCETASISKFSETILPLYCNPDYIKQIDRVFEAVDTYGNKSQCEQTVLLRRIDLSLIVFPDTLSIDNGNPLSCSTTTFDADGFPDLASAGVPTLNGNPIFPNVDVYCNIAVDYEDILVVDQLCVKKYMRTWRVYESWCSNGPIVEYFQVIQVVDNEGPSIVQPLNINVPAGAGPNCSTMVTLPIPVVTDDCPGTVSLDISYNGGFLRDVKTPPTVSFPAGVDTVKYRAYDACGNVDSVTINVVVTDSTPPTAVCDRHSVVSLRSDGTAKAWADTFDDGSFDNCGSIFKSVVRRLDNTCDCDTAQFKDMEFLGQRNGRYYYLSDHEVFGFQAIAYSQAFGGMPLTLESAAEATWVHDRVASMTTDPYYIGLSYKDNIGQYLYPDHTSPSYTNWAMGQPAESGTNVIVNADGTWQSVAGGTQKYRYIYEATIPCGYSDEVKFCCADAGNTVMIKFRTLDRFGGYNECDVEVEVQDKNAPVIQCPADLTLDCSTNINLNNLAIYGAASATDACTSNITDAVSSTLNSCGVGQVIRTFTATDANGMSTCNQTISLLSSASTTASSIVWPMDYETDQGCMAGDTMPQNLPAGFDFPDLSNASCTNLSATYSDKTFSFPGQGSTACFKVVRTWTVIDECMHGMPGYTPETYEQSLKISDSVAPTPTSCTDMNIVTTDCSGESVTITGSATDNCTIAANINSRISIDEMSDGTIDDDQSYNNMISYTRVFPLGRHTATLQYFDGCGNVGTCTQIINVTNNQPPTAQCVSISIPLQEMDLDNNNTIDTVMATIRASMLDAANPSIGTSGSSHPCMYDLSFSFSALLTDTIMTFDCTQIGDNSVTLYVTDSAGNTAECSTTVTVTDANDYCTTTTTNRIAQIGGNIMTEYAEAVEEVQVDLLGSDMPYAMTHDDGSYAFPQMSTGGDYMLIPTKNDDPLNGVSTLDIIRIQRHILGSELLDSPYKIIAADIDNSQSVTALDMIELRKLILGITDEFSKVDSWKMIASDQTFLDPLNPFLSGIQEDVMVEEFDHNMTVDFVGVKMGDVNNTVTANATTQNIDKRASESVDLLVTTTVADDESLTMDLSIEDLADYVGLQFALSYDPQSMDITGIESDLSSFINSNYNIDRDNHVIYISWDSKSQEISSDLLCQIKLSSKSNAEVGFSLDQSRLSSEIYTNESALRSLTLVNTRTLEVASETILYQNVPNPWSESTEIIYFLDRDQDIELNFYNPAGQLLYREIKTGVAGENISVIDNNTFTNGGIIYYELVTESTRIIDKMLLVK